MNRPSEWIRPDAVVAMLDHLTDGMFVFDADWCFAYINEPAAGMLGRSRDELLGAHAWTLFPEAVGGPSYTAYHRAREEGRAAQVTEYYEPLDRRFEIRIYPVGGELVVLFRDVTEQHRVAAELREYADRMAEAERIARFGVWKWDVAANTVLWSDELHRLYGVAPGEFAGTADDFVARLHPDDRERVWGHVSTAMETLEPFVFEERVIWPDGTERRLLSQGRVVPGPDGKAAALVGVCHDITERVEAQRALGASERRLRAIVDNSPSVVVVKDLDGNYSMANAEAGRIVGRSADDLIGRPCTEFYPADLAAQIKANDHVAAVEGRPVFDEAVLLAEDGEPRTFVTVTFPLPDDEGRPVEICTIATDVTEQRERDSQRRDRLEWRERIGSALAEDRMVVHAQPIVATATGDVVSWELLVRMTEGDELLQPGAFLPAAERYGLVQAIDCWVVGQALRLAEDRHLAVNLSAVTLCDAAARDEVVRLLSESPDAAANLVFELTETAALDHIEAASSFAAAVTAFGCGLALDDFGTGFGSFTYLRRLPLRSLKVDMTFVAGVTTSEDDRRVVQSIIGIARQFALEIVAEGVEDQATLELLREMGADRVQGFHLGRPALLTARVG